MADPQPRAHTEWLMALVRVDCPFCGAKNGEPCRSSSGRIKVYAVDYHTPRYTALFELERARG